MIRLVSVGGCSYAEFSEYLSRCKKVEHILVKEIKDKNPQVVQEKEGERLIAKAKGFVVVLSEEGNQANSAVFARLLQDKPEITFIVGGAQGVSQTLKEKADLVFSLSSFTLPHELAQLVLMEQIYRAQKINEGHPYHKS